MSKRRAPEEVRGADSDSALAVEREAPQAPDAPSLCTCDDLPEGAASGGAGRGAGPCRVLLQLPDSFDLTNAETFPMSKRRAPDSVPQSGGAGRGAGPCRVLLQLPDSFDLTNADTLPMSARPASLPFSAPMTLPMSAGALAPVAEIASATAVAISASDSDCGM